MDARRDSRVLQEIERAMLARSGRRAGKEIAFLCPQHENDGQPHEPSARWNAEKCVWYCDVCGTGGGLKDLAERLGVDLFAGLRRPSLTVSALARDKGLPDEFLTGLGLRNEANGRGVEIPYRGAAGDVVAWKRRTSLVARRGSYWPEGLPLHIYGAERLEEARKQAFVIIVEGESDCWTLWYCSFPALGLPGAGTARTLDATHLAGVGRVYVVQEPGKGGRACIAGVAKRLAGLGYAGAVSVVAFDKSIKDPNDLYRLDPRGFAEEMRRRLDRARPLALPKAEASAPSPGPKGRPEIDASQGDITVIAAEAWAAVSAANDPPFLFLRGTAPSRLGHDERGRPFTRPLGRDQMQHHLARVARWYRPVQVEGGEAELRMPSRPPGDLACDMLARPDIPLPRLNRIVTVPVLTATGRILSKEGYDGEARTLYVPAPGLTVPPVPDAPNAEDVRRARDLIAVELLGDFPFIGGAERAHAVSAMLLPFLRDLIEGPTPLYLIEKPAAGTGAGLLAEVLMYPALGGPPAVMSEGQDEDEWRKRLTAKLFTAPLCILLDNVRRRLDSAALAAALTAINWEDRLLGASEMVAVTVLCVWLATGNNPSLSVEIARRTARIRLDARIERPWLRDRSRFRHPDLRGWVKENRGELVWAALVLGRAWLAADRPEPSTPKLGSYEAWSVVMGGVLETSGIPGFLSNLDEVYEQSDAEESAWLALAEEWWATYGARAVRVRDVLKVIEREDLEIDVGDGGPQSRKTRLGIRLGSLRDRRLGRWVVRHGGHSQRANRWRLESCGEGGEPCEPSPPRAKDAGSPSMEDPRETGGGEGEAAANAHEAHNAHGGTGEPSYDSDERTAIRDEGGAA